ncbi:unnamed protein product [Brassica oleracea var. botrytis]
MLYSHLLHPYTLWLWHSLRKLLGPWMRLLSLQKVYTHLTGEGVKPDAWTYSLLVDAHLINRDPMSAMAVSDDMINAGIEPSKETLENLRRRCLWELDYKKDVQVESLAKKFQIRMGS